MLCWLPGWDQPKETQQNSPWHRVSAASLLTCDLFLFLLCVCVCALFPSLSTVRLNLYCCLSVSLSHYLSLPENLFFLPPLIDSDFDTSAAFSRECYLPLRQPGVCWCACVLAFFFLPCTVCVCLCVWTPLGPCLGNRGRYLSLVDTNPFQSLWADLLC